MAIIQTIRDKYAKLAGGIVVLALVGFVVGGSATSNFFGSNNNTVAKINGESIDIKTYQEMEQNALDQAKQRSGGELDENTTAQARTQAWGMMVQEHVLGDVYKKLGLEVTPKELNDLLYGDFIDPEILRQVPRDPNTGAIDREGLAQNIAQTRKDPDQKAQWQLFEQDLIRRRLRTKFNTMVAGSIYVPSFILNEEKAARSSFANAQLVNIPYASIPDAEVKNTDEELLDYMKKNPKKFTPRQDLRNIEYVSFEIKPTSQDTATALNALLEIKDDFQNTSADEALAELVSLHSDLNLAPNYFTREQMSNFPDAEALWNAANNSVVGPNLNNGSYTMAKIVDKKVYPDSTKYRHIIVVVKTGDQERRKDAEAKARIDSAITALSQGVPFDSVAIRFSDDVNMLQQGGSYTVTPQGISMMLDASEADFLFSGKPGDKKLIKFDNERLTAYQYAEILSQGATNTYAKVAIIGKPLEDSKESFDIAYANASQFLGKAKDGAAFDEAAKQMGLTVTPAANIMKNSELIQGLGASKELSKWIYSANVGEVSKHSFKVGNKYVVAKLSSIQEKGKIVLNDDNRQSADFLLKKEKKAKMIMEKNNGQPSLEAIAAANNQTVAAADSINLSNGYVPAIGNDPRVIGYIFSKNVPANKLSKGIPGANGVVYVVVSNRFTTPDAAAGSPAMERKMYSSQLRSAAPSYIMNTLVEKADIVDKRN